MYCARHSGTDAVWECLRCQALACDACVRLLGTPPREVKACSHCGDGLLRPLAVRRVAPLPERLGALLARPFGATGLVTIAVVAVLAAASDVPIPLIDVVFGAVYVTALAGTYFNVVDHVGTGHAGFPAPVEPSGWSTRTLAIRGLLLVLIAFLPFGLWLRLDRGAEDVGELFARHPWTALALLVLVLAWLTAALLAVLDAVSGLAAFWPPALASVVGRAPELYLKLFGLVLATSFVCWGARWLAAAALGGVPFLSGLALGAVTAAVLFCQAALVGGFVREHREVYATR
jgi:hypothetical protein